MRVLALITLCALCACSCAQTSAVKTRIYADPRLEISLYRSGASGATPPAAAYSHPADFKVEELKYLLGSIRYRDKSLFGWSDTRRVFSASELYRMTPHLVEAFARATPGDEVRFASTAAKRGAIFSSKRFTSGKMFVANKKVNCLFANINSLPDRSEAFGADSGKQYSSSMAMLVTNDWQSLGVDEKGTRDTRIEIDYESGLAEMAELNRALKEHSERRPVLRPRRPRGTGDWEDWDPGRSLDR